MTDEQIKELFDTVPAFADSCIESLRPAPFLRSISRCLSASVNTGLIYVTVNPNYPGMTWRELLDDPDPFGAAARGISRSSRLMRRQTSSGMHSSTGDCFLS